MNRSQRVKHEARTRPDVLWQEHGVTKSVVLPNGTRQKSQVLAGGSELTQLIATADQLQISMRQKLPK